MYIFKLVYCVFTLFMLLTCESCTCPIIKIIIQSECHLNLCADLCNAVQMILLSRLLLRCIVNVCVWSKDM